ncbi:ABC-type Fe3+ transport system, permease component [Halalkaliarchaeum sp. AArc-CO]|nr:ABC-type Fe3+ transport system, permease component [Halalkaliarchaeum sp. AArc-CO]
MSVDGSRTDVTEESSAPPTDDAGSDTVTQRAFAGIERYAIGLGAAATGLVLVAVFYYPVATVFREAFFPEGLLTGSVFVSILTDPFYMGELGRLLSGEPPGEVLRRIASPDRQLGILGFTAYQAALSTVASVALGVPAAWILARFEFRGRETLRSLTILPFVLPSIMVAVGFVATFGRNGTLNAILGTVGVGPVELMFTLEAIVIAHAFYNAPLVARVVTAAWEAVDARAIETARSLGASPHRAFLDVVAPQLYPAVLMGATLTFVFTFASFPIVLALGGFQLATVEVFIYRLIRDLNYAEAAGLAILELVISLSLTYAYLRYEAANAVRRGASAPGRRKQLFPRTWTPTALLERFAVAGYALLAVAVFVLPLASMIWASLTGPAGFTLDHYRFLLERQATGAAFQVQPWPAVRNSLVFAVATLGVAVPMGLVVAVATTRRYRGRKVVDALAMAPFAVSGIIVGLGLLRGLVFGVEIGGWRITVAGAVAIVAAHAVSAYPFVTRNVAPGLEGLDPALTESARALGASRARALVDVELPLVWPGVVAGAAFAVAISIGEFNSTIVLATGTDSYTMPVAVERYLGRRLGPATAMGVVLLAVTSASFIVVERLGGYVRH